MNMMPLSETVSTRIELKKHVRRTIGAILLLIGLQTPVLPIAGAQTFENHPVPGVDWTVRSLFTDPAPADISYAGISPIDAPILGGEPQIPELEHVRLAVRIDPTIDKVYVRTILNFSEPPDANILLLPVPGLGIEEVLVNDRVTEWNVEAERLSVALADSLISGEYRLSICYDATARFHTLSRRSGLDAVWTTPGNMGADWLPLPASSHDAFTTDLTLSLPGDWIVPAEDSVRVTQLPVSEETGHRVVLIRPTQPVVAHDIGFFAAQSDRVRPVDSVYVFDTGVSGRPGAALSAELGSVRSFLSDSLDLALPTHTTPHILVTGSPSGATGLTAALHGPVGLPADSPWLLSWQRHRDAITALLTPGMTRIPLSDIWLVRAIPAMLATDLVRRTHGSAAAADIRESLRTAYLQESRHYLRPLVYDRWANAGDLDDAHATARGLWVLHMLRQRVGDDAFWQGVRGFLKADRTIRDSEVLREQIETASGHDLSDFFDTWIYAAGHPVLQISYSHSSGTERVSVEIAQTQDGVLVPEYFPMDVELRYSSLAGVSEASASTDGRVTRFTLPAEISPTYLHLDTRANWLFEYSSRPALDDIISHLRHDESVASRIRSYHLLASSQPDAGLLFGIRSAINSETDPIMLAVALRIPAQVVSTASSERLLHSYLAHESGIVRAAALRGLISFDGEQTGEAALRAANSDTNPHVLSAAVPALVRTRGDMAWTVIESALVTPSPEHRVRIEALKLVGLTAHSDRERSSVLLDHTGVGQPYAVRRTAALVAARHFAELRGVQSLAESWLDADSVLLRRTALEMIELMPSEIRTNILSRLASRVNDTADTSRSGASIDPDPVVRTRLARLLDELVQN